MAAQATRAPMSAGRFWLTYALLAAGPFLSSAMPRTLAAAGFALAAGALIVVLTLPLYLFDETRSDKGLRQKTVMLAAFTLACMLGLANLVWRAQF